MIGNCGLGAAPLFGEARDLAPAVHAWMTPEGASWRWESLADYFSTLETRGLPLNVAALVPHGLLRLGAMGLRPGAPDARERAAMAQALERSLEEGAYGLSCGLIYPPGMFSATEELLGLARALRASDAVFTAHVRGSSETLLPAVEELIEVGRDAEVRVHHSHAEAVGRDHWEKLAAFLEMERAARGEGVRVSADMFPYPVAATMMYAIYPPWALEGGPGELLTRLRDPETRDRIGRDIEERAPEWPPWQPGGWPHNLVSAVGWDGIQVSSVASDAGRGALGRSLAELGQARGTHPFEAISDLMLSEEGAVGQFVLDISGEDGLRTLVSDPEVAFITDANDYGKGSPHPAAYGAFPRVLRRYVREEGVISLAEAVRRMTSLPADIVGLRDRGRIANNLPADLVLFDRRGDHRPRHPRGSPGTGHWHPRHLRERPAREPGRPLHRRAAGTRAPQVRLSALKEPAMLARTSPLRRLTAVGLVFAILAGGCSIVLTQGPPKPGEADYDVTGAYPGGVPCTSSRMWPLVDLGFMLWALALTMTYDNRDDQIDGSLTSAAAAISAWFGYRRTNACRDAQAGAAMPLAPPPG